MVSLSFAGAASRNNPFDSIDLGARRDAFGLFFCAQVPNVPGGAVELRAAGVANRMNVHSRSRFRFPTRPVEFVCAGVELPVVPLFYSRPVAR